MTPRAAGAEVGAERLGFTATGPTFLKGIDAIDATLDESLEACTAGTASDVISCIPVYEGAGQASLANREREAD